MFAVNEGPIDRAVRVLLGAALVALALFAVDTGSAAGVALLAVGIVLGATGAVGFCALYKVFGFDTCPAPRTGR